MKAPLTFRRRECRRTIFAGTVLFFAAMKVDRKENMIMITPPKAGSAAVAAEKLP